LREGSIELFGVALILGVLQDTDEQVELVPHEPDFTSTVYVGDLESTRQEVGAT